MRGWESGPHVRNRSKPIATGRSRARIFHFHPTRVKLCMNLIRNSNLISTDMRWVPIFRCQWHFDEKPTAAPRARVKNIEKFRKNSDPHMRTALSTPHFCRKQFQGKATRATTQFWRVFARFAYFWSAIINRFSQKHCKSHHNACKGAHPHGTLEILIVG